MTIPPITDEELLKQHYEKYRQKGDVFSEDWVRNYFDSRPSHGLDITYSNQTNSGNASCGDEAERIYSQRVGDLDIYWAQNSTGGARGPFRDLDDAIKALGYDPDCFDIEYGPFDPDSECPDAECPYCGTSDSKNTCNHLVATINDDEIEGGMLQDAERVETWATWIESALTKGKKRGVKPIGISSASSLNELSEAAKTRIRKAPYRVNSSMCVGVVRELLEESDALMEERDFFNGGSGPQHLLDFYSKDPDQLVDQCEERLRKWLELPDTGNK